MSGRQPTPLEGAPRGRPPPSPKRAPRRVQALPDSVIDQIAAGEVVERPASVVKELVENALDAGASRVRIEVRAGGRDWIAVTDDGCGMAPEDARLALQRHATSKIRDADDLAHIASFGFRGEALPAIASVSRLRLRTRAADRDEAVELLVAHGEAAEERRAGAPPGTRVEVADLFGNVPARRKFLKTAVTEWGHVADWLARSALALPRVHFELRRDDRPALTWPAVDALLDRIAAVAGEEEASGLVEVDREEGPARLHGFMSRPDRHRPTLAGVRLFVNGRSIRDRLIQHALVEVYRDVLPRGRFPSAVLFLDLPPDRVDVNVHPAKWEVRFAEPSAIHQLVRHAAGDALAGRRWLGSTAPEPEATHATSGRPAARGAAPLRGRGAGGAAEPAGQGDWVFAGASPGAVGEGARPPLAAALPGLEPAPLAPGAPVRFGDLKLLGQLLATYLVLETKGGLLLVDQHAAHERVLYERLRAEWRQGAVERQALLAPATLSLDPRGLRALLDAREALERMGFEVDAFGETTAAVRALPALLAQRDPAALVRDLADELVAAGPGAAALGAGRRGPEAAERLFAGLACHSARRKGDLLPPAEQHALLDALDAIPWAPTCPHGRPVAVPWELSEIERRFARR